ncbi:hypothetical protein CDO52_00655 [Nocardiopsis gilva YIM 90087]|uniref:Uncharacterized protein n=1 Tax=Nocardiopsis gilva YIM 90087 TaxID=1235441 RepID=A0A223S0D7_9ACTN|nr:hypothetical protein [Nocardiopsis gilva]ASU81489.1 hypothetical protein CDO52_00655 [Nocardiopsis gilva YIM 90087]
MSRSDWLDPSDYADMLAHYRSRTADEERLLAAGRRMSMSAYRMRLRSNYIPPIDALFVDPWEVPESWWRS